MTESELERYSSEIVNAKKNVRYLDDTNGKVKLSLQGIHIKDNLIFYHFRIMNTSNINYDVDFLRFYIHDRQKVKRTASQEVDIEPVFVHGNAETIKGQSAEDLVFVLEKFTIPDARRLIIEVFEENGGRHLELSIKNRRIVNARLID
jgi:conjugative transposon TraN protein